MIDYLPIALINGAEHFVAKKLAEELAKKDLNVVGVSQGFLEGWMGGKWEEHRGVWEVKKRVNYVFDFVGDEEVWNKAEEDGAKLTVVWVGKGDWGEVERRLKQSNCNWRLVIGIGVYGPGMNDDEFLAKVVRAAAGNKSLSLPGNNKPVRVLAAEDLVEAVLRASFLSGTENETLLVAGEEIRSERIAEVLISEAKMTKIEVKEYEGVVEEVPRELVERMWGKLRWRPGMDFKDGIKETLQYFFARVDEENRRKKLEEKNKGKGFLLSTVENEPVREDRRERMAVEVVEEDRTERQPVMEIVAEEVPKPPKKWTEVMVEDSLSEADEVEEATKFESDEELLVTETGRPAELKKHDGYKTEKKTSDVEQKERKIQHWKQIEEDETEEVEIEEGDEEEVQPSGKIEQVNPWEERMQSWKQLADQKPETNREVTTESSAPAVTSPVIKPKMRLRVEFKYKWLVTGVVGAVLVGVSVGMPAAWAWTGYQAGKGAVEFQKLVTEGKSKEAEKMVTGHLTKVRNVESKIDEYGLKRLGVFRNLATGLKVVEEVLLVEKDSLGVMERGERLSEAALREGEADWQKELDALSKEMEVMESRMGLLQARLSGDLRWVPGRWRSELQKGVKQMEEGKSMMGLGRKALKFLPEILGTDGKRREFLLVFQNEMEIRPTGGFIGSYGIITFEDGKLINLEIKDIYSADGQLKGHVEPPEEIKVHLGEAGWYMRDANWQASFTATSKDLMWFLDKETGRRVDGVIGVNLASAQEILGVIGEVYVPDFKEKVNKNNLYEQAEFYSENKFFPGSNQKESFLGLLGKQLFEEIKNLKGGKKIEMAQAIMSLLERNEIQIALNEKMAAAEVARLGWDGSLYEGKCAMEGCVADYLYLVEANFGVNKANYFIYRNIEQMVEITPSIVSRVVKVNYENTAKNTNWPGGDYKNYLRVYVPSEVNLSEVSVYNSDDPTSKKVYKSEELKIKTVGDKKEIGFLVTVPVLKKRTVEVRYATAIDLNKTEKFSYLNYIQRQSGYGQTGYVGLVAYPEGWGPVQVQPTASLVGNKLLFNQKFDRDIKMGVEISK